ncbi:methylenetetrahydrofolate reductase C-terminal domain-containing protein [Ruegeria sp. HKCCA4008]|uniref:methylenetetrahydrofolate reductase C-terminal domain-containing protein n=1 Tax=Ruegeria sp. HKCCA4008 TaxID=2682999 RepID=UPI0014881930|nr:methylenetetrahydrofolate reductase C-terminal domain-containing protein [Ruegeria sp. HKCCA4008]
MYRLRLFAIRNARAFEWIYKRVERGMVAMDPVFAKIGYNRVERPIALVEKGVKSLLFDCKMCGQCVLSSTGMSCPMNCPKQLRNGPCGGVRPGEFCEVKPDMKCVWALAWDGASRMQHGGDKIKEVLPPLEHTLKGSSSWLRVSREIAAQEREARDAARETLAQAFPEARENEPSAAPLAAEPPNAVNRELKK